MNDLFQLDPHTRLSAGREGRRQMLDEGWARLTDPLPSPQLAMFVPVDILDTGAALLIRAAMPGVKAENIKIFLNGNVLELSGEVEAQAELEDATYLLRDPHTSAYSRSVTLPVAVNASKAQATLRDGMIFLTLPKRERIRPECIRVTPS